MEERERGEGRGAWGLPNEKKSNYPRGKSQRMNLRKAGVYPCSKKKRLEGPWSAAGRRLERRRGGGAPQGAKVREAVTGEGGCTEVAAGPRGQWAGRGGQAGGKTEELIPVTLCKSLPPSPLMGLWGGGKGGVEGSWMLFYPPPAPQKMWSSEKK